MKSLTKTLSNKWVLPGVISIFIFSACQKEVNQKQPQQEIATVANPNSEHGHLKQTNTYSSEVVIKWMDMQLELLRTTLPAAGQGSSRHIAYSGIALYESVVAGMPAYQSIAGQLNGSTDMPVTSPGFAYHWPACANAALAFMNRHFYPTASAAKKTSLDSLENALNNLYKTETNHETFQRSVEFGKAVAQLVFDWSTTDGSANVNPPYVLPTGPGLWVPVPPAFGAPVVPYFGNNRLFVQGSLDGSEPPLPLAYSTDPNSAYYKQVKEVYDVSQTLTPEQAAIGLYWRDNPGYFGPGHFMSVTKQILQQINPSLDVAAIAYAKTGIAVADAMIGSLKSKYQYFTERPITYIRNVLGHAAWNSLFNTPAQPEYPSAHANSAGAAGETLNGLFGANLSYTDHSYDYLGMAPHVYNSIQDLYTEMINARIYAGIHIRYACEEGIKQGRKIAHNIDSKLKFLKE